MMSEVRNNKSSESVTTFNNIDQALDARDAIAKSLYSTLFTWLVTRVNKIIGGGTTGQSFLKLNSKPFNGITLGQKALSKYRTTVDAIWFIGQRNQVLIHSFITYKIYVSMHLLTAIVW
jgi:hypothetical protein